MDFGVTGQGLAATVTDYAPNKTATTINYTKEYPISKDRQKRGRAQSAGAFKPFNTLGDQYWVPVRDHKYQVNSTYKICEAENKVHKDSDTFIG